MVGSSPAPGVLTLHLPLPSLFPTMPRHNLHKIAPLVKSLCAKHGIEYQEKPLLKALLDIIRSLKKSGELWLDAYLHK